MTKFNADYHDKQMVNWEPVVKRMIKELTRGNAWWRQDSMGQEKGSENDGRTWWFDHGCHWYDTKYDTTEGRKNRAGKKAELNEQWNGRARPSLLEIWNARKNAPEDEELNKHPSVWGRWGQVK